MKYTLSAVFASLTAIFAKVGLEGIDADYTTFPLTTIVCDDNGTLAVDGEAKRGYSQYIIGEL